MADGRLSLRWIELGGPTVTPPTRRGFGTRIMENIIAQLNGEVRCGWRNEGLGSEIAQLLVYRHAAIFGAPAEALELTGATSV